MNRVLLVATTTGYQIRSFGEAADRLGVELVLASDRCDHLDDPWRDGAIPVRFHDEAASVSAVARGAAPIAPSDGVLAVGDRPAVLAARRRRGARACPAIRPTPSAASRNKLLTRRAFQSGRPAGAAFFDVSMADDPVRPGRPACTYPAVVKPLALSGSRGVIRVDDASGFVAAFDRVRALLQSPDVRKERDAVARPHADRVVRPGRE